MSEKCTCEHPVRDCIEAENCVGVQRFSKPRNELAALKRQRDMLLEAVKKYADRQNWGYYDDSGCDKGHGEYTDACFIGPEVAQAVIAAVEGEK